MRPVVYTVTGTETSNVYPLDHYVSPFNIALSVLVSGTSNYTVQYTFDDVFAKGYNPATGNWVNHPNLTSQTATQDSNIAYPVRGIRIIANSGAGTATLTAIQAGGGGLA
jgi:hypothetical protein